MDGVEGSKSCVALIARTGQLQELRLKIRQQFTDFHCGKAVFLWSFRVNLHRDSFFRTVKLHLVAAEMYCQIS
jgi:hypothetical protein